MLEVSVRSPRFIDDGESSAVGVERASRSMQTGRSLWEAVTLAWRKTRWTTHSQTRMEHPPFLFQDRSSPQRHPHRSEDTTPPAEAVSLACCEGGF